MLRRGATARLDEPDGSFTTRSSGGTVDFTVLSCRGDTFDLHRVSHINGLVGTEHMVFSPDH
ncbi:hypothetical protein [Actinoallomurus sp. NPDC050550]|uniref:hypothetical protein n=1 Tax=Actinoallomurus sp. NPDC050550 TaxID=3154937 RepID=UPI0033FF38D1